MKTTLIATVLGTALVILGVLATTFLQSTFAIGQGGSSSVANGDSTRSGGSAGTAGIGGILVGQHASANPGSAEAKNGSISVQGDSKQKAGCDNNVVARC